MNFRGGRASPKTATFTAQADLLILMTETDAADMNVSIREKLQNQGASLLGFCLYFSTQNSFVFSFLFELSKFGRV